MKKILILLVLALSMVSCFETFEDNKKRIIEEYGECQFTLEIEYVTGTVETVTYTLPTPTEFVVDTYKGSYTLDYYYDIESGYTRTLKAGVVRYKLLKKTCN
jgi:hypothetical protein